ncbi:hypothetical protein ACGFYY_03415 [Streptomyces sp. NPDC048331]|uniref:hypothetical protein n=1 Tax=Streptomyces sp. NPDC048331 TaxID=3365534 RepID=UPI00371CC7D6
MTTAKLPTFLRRTAEEDELGAGIHSGAIRIGKWTFIPGSGDREVTQNATLEHDSLEIDLSYSSSIFEDFLRTMSTIQFDFGRRLEHTAAAATAAAGECSDGSSRV